MSIPGSIQPGSDFRCACRLLHNVALNGTLGVISGLGNIAPAALVNIFKLYKQGDFEAAKKAQEAVSIAGELEIKGGVPGMRVCRGVRTRTRVSFPV